MKDNMFKVESERKNYARTAVLILLKAFDDVLGPENIDKIVVEFSMGDNYFIFPNLKNGKKLDNRIIADIWTRMHDYIEQDLPITKKVMRVDEAIDSFNERGMTDIAKLLHFRRTSKVTLSCFEGYETYFYGSVLKNSGAITAFDLMPYRNGLFLMLPTEEDPEHIQQFDPVENLFESQSNAYKLSHLLQCENIADMNELICEGDTTELILTCESMFEHKLHQTAHEIVGTGRKFVFVAGPSSSGKTSTANRLAYALRINGTKPRLISADNYYLDHDLRPITEDGKPDFESIDALDLELFNEHMAALLDGETVEMPRYDFATGKRVYSGDKLHLGPREILIVEGIHCMNERFSASIPADQKYKIYVSALSPLNIDEHNRVPTSDVRLLRRIVRDFRTRGYSAAATISRWPDVRRGEEKNIFPYQGEADATINTALIYELAVIKPHVERILFGIPRGSEEYEKARELLKFLDFVLPVATDQIPPDSIICEFIGGSCMDVG